MMRNFLYAFADYYLSYYQKIESTLFEKAEKMKMTIQEHPELIVPKGRFKDYVVFQLKNEELLHAFSYGEGPYIDFLYRKQEAEENFQKCKMGMLDA